MDKRVHLHMIVLAVVAALAAPAWGAGANTDSALGVRIEVPAELVAEALDREKTAADATTAVVDGSFSQLDQVLEPLRGDDVPADERLRIAESATRLIGELEQRVGEASERNQAVWEVQQRMLRDSALASGESALPADEINRDAYELAHGLWDRHAADVLEPGMEKVSRMRELADELVRGLEARSVATGVYRTRRQLHQALARTLARDLLLEHVREVLALAGRGVEDLARREASDAIDPADPDFEAVAGIVQSLLAGGRADPRGASERRLRALPPSPFK